MGNECTGELFNEIQVIRMDLFFDISKPIINWTENEKKVRTEQKFHSIPINDIQIDC